MDKWNINNFNITYKYIWKYYNIQNNKLISQKRDDNKKRR